MVRASAKSPDAFRTISEAADALDLPQHVLRFWETRFSQIKPMKRSGGRRYYRPSDIALLRGIRHLLYDEGYTIKGVQRILREQGIAHVVSTRPPGAAEVGGGLSPNQTEALVQALRTLMECKSQLDQARPAPAPAEPPSPA
jgi:DNA-binding transcriptional MerR regulator